MKVQFAVASFALVLLSGCHSLAPQEASSQSSTPAVQRMPHFIRDHVQQLYAGDASQRAQAAYELSKLEATAAPAVPHLVARLGDSASAILSQYMGGGYYSRFETTPAAEAARALGKIGDAAIDGLIEALQHDEPRVRQHAAKALGMIRATQAIDPLVDSLGDENAQVRGAVVIALSRYRHPRTAAVLLERLPTVGPVARRELIYVLARISDPIVVAELIDYATDSDVHLRAAVAYALGEQRDHRVVPVLISMLNDEDAVVRANAAYALGNYGGTDIVPFLISALDDETSAVRESAARSLFEITGKDLGTTAVRWQRWWQRQGLSKEVPATENVPQTEPKSLELEQP